MQAVTITLLQRAMMSIQIITCNKITKRASKPAVSSSEAAWWAHIFLQIHRNERWKT